MSEIHTIDPLLIRTIEQIRGRKAQLEQLETYEIPADAVGVRGTSITTLQKLIMSGLMPTAQISFDSASYLKALVRSPSDYVYHYFPLASLIQMPANIRKLMIDNFKSERNFEKNMSTSNLMLAASHYAHHQSMQEYVHRMIGEIIDPAEIEDMNSIFQNKSFHLLEIMYGDQVGDGGTNLTRSFNRLLNLRDFYGDMNLQYIFSEALKRKGVLIYLRDNELLSNSFTTVEDEKELCCKLDHPLGIADVAGYTFLSDVDRMDYQGLISSLG